MKGDDIIIFFKFVLPRHTLFTLPHIVDFLFNDYIKKCLFHA